MTPPFPARPARLSAGVHTVRRMRSEQLVGMGVRKARELVIPRLPVDFDRRYERRVPADPLAQPDVIAGNNRTLRACLTDGTRDRYRTRAREAAGGVPTFLNRSLGVADGADVGWYDDRFDGLPLLWSLKLYAFQPLAWTVAGFDPDEGASKELAAAFDEWIESWLASVELGRPGYLRRAWTPWAVSLRILHWSRYLAWRRGAEPRIDPAFDLALRRELYRNALFLRNHLERDVGGNHLIENGAALVAAGVLFDERGLIDEGTDVLSEAAREQFLADGCHFERSPMYHVLTLTRYLTVRDLLERNGRPVPEELWTVADRATTFLRYLRPPDGRIPLLNDAVYGQALPLEDCLRYADAVGAGSDPGSATRPPAADASTSGTSGYLWLRTDDGAMLVDGGPVGPPHLPGHSHSDTLSVLAWLDDRQVFTDTGTYGYVGDDRRRYARGVRGHNTVQVGDVEPISLAGKYLMGLRPEPTTRFRDGPVSLFEGCYEAAPDRSTNYVHTRAAYAGDRWWLLRDAVWGHNGEPTRGRFHVHPDVDASLESTGRVRLDLGDDGEAYVYPTDGARFGVGTGWYYPRFGEAVSRPVLELHADDVGVDPASLGCLLTRRDLEEVSVETARDEFVATELRLADETSRLPPTRLHETAAGASDPSSS